MDVGWLVTIAVAAAVAALWLGVALRGRRGMRLRRREGRPGLSPAQEIQGAPPRSSAGPAGGPPRPRASPARERAERTP